MTTLWVRFRQSEDVGFGTLEGDVVHEHRGDMFAGAAPDPLQRHVAHPAGTLVTLTNII